MSVIPLADHDRRAPNHRWGPRILVNDGAVHGCEQSERTCLRCGLVRVTVHPPQGLPWREWRPQGGPQMQFEHTPPCLPKGAGERAPSSSDTDSLSLRAPAVQGVCPHESRNPQDGTRSP